MDRCHRAAQAQALLDLHQRRIGLLGDQALELCAMQGHQSGLAARKAMPRGKLSGLRPLTEQLLNHPQRHLEPPGHFLPRAFLRVIRLNNPLSQVQ